MLNYRFRNAGSRDVSTGKIKRPNKGFLSNTRPVDSGMGAGAESQSVCDNVLYFVVAVWAYQATHAG